MVTICFAESLRTKIFRTAVKFSSMTKDRRDVCRLGYSPRTRTPPAARGPSVNSDAQDESDRFAFELHGRPPHATFAPITGSGFRRRLSHSKAGLQP